MNSLETNLFRSCPNVFQAISEIHKKIISSEKVIHILPLDFGKWRKVSSPKLKLVSVQLFTKQLLNNTYLYT